MPRDLIAAYDAMLSARPLIVLAQASMARVLEALPSGAVAAPVLASPELGVKFTRDVMSG